MRGQADFLRPYDLIERVSCIATTAAANCSARLGPEAEDGIDELLAQALAYETSAEVPSLTGFLVWMETDDIEVKRQLDGEGSLIRVMTVHGAKGLEAPTSSSCPTCADYPSVQQRTEIHTCLARAVVVNRRLEGGERGKPRPHRGRARLAKGTSETAERLRLLYVAMTRARCWLIAARPSGEVTKDDDSLAPADPRRGGPRRGAGELDDGMGRGTAGATGHCRQPRSATGVTGGDRPPAPLPRADYPARRQALRRCSQRCSRPSDLGGAKALPGEPPCPEGGESPLARGTALHLLLERSAAGRSTPTALVHSSAAAGADHRRPRPRAAPCAFSPKPLVLAVDPDP